MGKAVGSWRLLGFITLFVSGCPSTPDPIGVDGGPGREAGPPCAVAADCADGRYCNGVELCMPGSADADERGCMAGTLPCLASQRCSETEGRCVTACAIAADADGDSADSVDCGGSDCDDTDAMRAPDLTEVCDVANRDEDCDPSTFGSRDGDGDGFVDAACCNMDGTAMRCGDDCNDSRRDTHPGSTEACERIDNDCDGVVDEGLTVMAWPDRDFDLHGVEDDSMRTEVCPGTPGYSLVADDCDDASPTRHRAQLEICDSIDNDCDGTVDEAPVAIAWYPDEDGDLFGAPDASMPSGGVVISCTPIPGRSTRSSDCDDSDAQVHPGSRELCNAIDDDCNGTADAGALRPGDTEDDDGDQYPDVVCGGNDCDDRTADVHPGAPELCNMRDDDCDTVVDGGSAMAMWYLDLDRDGYGDSSLPSIMSCSAQGGRVPRGDDCNDGNASIHPRVPDPCNAGFMPIDEDCDGSFDENGIRFAYFPDADGDGWGTNTTTGLVFACTRPALTADRPGDCEDTRATRYPGAPELCQMLDDDCDAAIDEDSDQNWYIDADRDGHGAGTPILSCTAPSGRVTLGDDCDDMNAGRFPGNAELCNNRDDDCDTMIDDGASVACSAFTFSTGVCTAGACVLACDPGHANCDGVVASGCEVDTGRSPSYCGACTNACRPGDTCGAIAASGTCDASPVVSIAAAGSHVFAVRATGGVAAWGDATFSVTTSALDSAEPFGTSLSGVTMVQTVDDTSCAITAGRRVLCWGSNSAGALGDGGSIWRGAPGEVVGITDAIDLSVGAEHACAVRAGGAVSCWGRGLYGRTGNGSASDTAVSTPVLVPGIGNAVEVYAGTNFTCALRGTAGARYVTCWGWNGQGQCGLGGTTPNEILAPGASVVGLPADVVGLANGSGNGTCAWTSGGQVYCWGYDASGYQLGLGASSGPPLATLMPAMTGVVDVVLTTNAGCLRRNGAAAGRYEVWCWGAGSIASEFWINETTRSTTTPRRAGTSLVPIDDAVAIAVAGPANNHTWCAVRASGSVVCMGSDSRGLLGDGLPLLGVAVPTAVLALP